MQQSSERRSTSDASAAQHVYDTSNSASRQKFEATKEVLAGGTDR